MIEKTYIEDEVFEGYRYRERVGVHENYENCTFINCDFSDTKLSATTFVECEFRTCNLSMAKVLNSSFRDVRFIDSKILGVKFDECEELLFSASFESCKLDHSSFYGLALQKIVFADCSVQGVDFANCNLQKASFTGCDLAGAIFAATNLEGADFRGAINYSIDPTANRIKKAHFELPEVIGLLHYFDVKIS